MYVVLLVAAYRRYELSVVYPVARGLAPVLVLVLSVIVALSWPSAGEVVGVLAVAAGVLLVRGFRGSLGGLLAGALIAAVIAGYTVADRYGIHHANAAPYLMLVLLASGGRLSAVRRADAVREGVRARDGRDRRRLGVRVPARAARVAAGQRAGGRRRPRDERRDRDRARRGRA